MSTILFWPPKCETAPILDGPEEAQIAAVMRGIVQCARLARSGVDPPSRVLMHGPTGTGKTLTARWIAARLGLPIAIAQLDRVIGSHLGETAANLHNLFDEATSRTSLLFLDEIDGIASRREGADQAASREMARATSSLLQQLDGLPVTQLVIAATNLPDELDSALRRRFPLEVAFRAPSDAARRAMLDGWLAGAALPDGMLETMVTNSRGMSGAALRASAMEEARTILLDRWDAEPPPSAEAIAEASMSADERLLRADFGRAFPGDDWPGYAEAFGRISRAERAALEDAPTGRRAGKQRRLLDAR